MIFEKKITPSDIAQFESVVVHEVYATFSLARDVEWTCRLFVLKMKDEAEEGIGTALEIKHISPAFINETITITATLSAIQENEIHCTFIAKVKDRLIASGSQTQKILPKSILKSYFSNFKK